MCHKNFVILENLNGAINLTKKKKVNDKFSSKIFFYDLFSRTSFCWAVVPKPRDILRFFFKFQT